MAEINVCVHPVYICTLRELGRSEKMITSEREGEGGREREEERGRGREREGGRERERERENERERGEERRGEERRGERGERKGKELLEVKLRGEEDLHCSLLNQVLCPVAHACHDPASSGWSLG